MMMVLVLSLVFLGFGIGLQSNARVPGAVDRKLAIHRALVEKMEDLVSLGFDTLSANSGLSDTVTLNNQTYSRIVTVADCDAGGDGTLDSDFIEITVAIADQDLKTRMTRP
jgi:hypothetical protein